jgi:2,3-bisphosphoglycerate-dependent phosphoglycerate mutase
MTHKLFVFRHAETFDNSRGLFSGWRDSALTQNGVLQARKIAKQLRSHEIDYAFASHLKRARQTLKIVLENHPPIPVFVDDRLIERCYGLFQGESKKMVEYENPEFYDQYHRGYYLAPPKGESMEMVERRVMSFLTQLKEWLKQNPGNIAISCHNNSIRPFRMFFENLSLRQMCKVKNPQDHALIYEIELDKPSLFWQKQTMFKVDWQSILISKNVRLATDPRNLLNKYYS